LKPEAKCIVVYDEHALDISVLHYPKVF